MSIGNGTLIKHMNLNWNILSILALLFAILFLNIRIKIAVSITKRKNFACICMFLYVFATSWDIHCTQRSINFDIDTRRQIRNAPKTPERILHFFTVSRDINYKR